MTLNATSKSSQAALRSFALVALQQLELFSDVTARHNKLKIIQAIERTCDCSLLFHTTGN